jgi:hypothetical protein
MALPDPVAKSHLDRVASDIGGLLGTDPIYINTHMPAPDGAPSELEIGDTFAVFTIPGDGLADAANAGLDLLDVAVPTNYLHHQVIRGNRAAYARSLDEAHAVPDKPALHVFTVSPLAVEIERAANDIDEHDPDDAIVIRMLEVPSFKLRALWLVERGANTSRVHILTASKSLDLAPHDVIPSTELLRRLAVARPISGVIRPKR